MNIKEAGDKLGVTPRAIRLYEKKGLLSPRKREDNRYREFSEKDLWRLQTIVSLRESGMSLSDIGQALEKWEENGMEELRYYLELQRSVLMSEWLQLRQVLETADRMIGLLRSEKTLPIDHLYRLASASKALREQRANWKDRWDFNRLAPGHDERVAAPSGEYANYGEALDRVADRIDARAGEKGLDVGTGTGNLAGLFLGRGCAMSGVDQSREMLRLCRAKYPDMETRLGNFLALPYLEEKFDFVVSSFAFHHLAGEQQLLALEEMRRVLKPGGRICIADSMGPDSASEKADPVSRPEHSRASARARAAARAPERPEDPYPSAARLRQWLEANGFAVETERLNETLHLIYAH